MEKIQTLIDLIALSKKRCSYPISGKLAYATPENFIGRIIDGYSATATDVCLMAKKAAAALCEIQNELVKNNLGLFIYDAYRPLRAVKDFAKWFYQSVAGPYEIERKKIHYPNIEKTELVKLGYAPETISRHNFGHAIDLTLIDINTHQPLDMGACFDFFDELSHATVTKKQIGAEAYQNRKTLTHIMQKYGFIPYEFEFWHFDYHIQEIDEPLDITIESGLKNLNVT